MGMGQLDSAMRDSASRQRAGILTMHFAAGAPQRPRPRNGLRCWHGSGEKVRCPSVRFGSSASFRKLLSSLIRYTYAEIVVVTPDVCNIEPAFAVLSNAVFPGENKIEGH
jgi:hypothetical protein